MKFRFTALAILSLTAVAVSAWANTYSVNKNDVIPIKFDDQISTATAHVGDSIKATVMQNPILPDGTKFLGEVDKSESATDSKNGVLELSFNTIEFPNGTMVPIESVPIPLSKKYVDKNKDGRYVGKPSVSKASALGAGALAGFLIGALINKPFEGTFLGSIIGIVVGETNSGPQQAVISKDTELGAYIQQTTILDDDPNDNKLTIVQMNPDPTGPANPSDLVVNGTQLTFPAGSQPFKVGNAVLVPLKLAASQLNLQVTEGSQFVYLDSPSHSLRIDKSSAAYRLDGASKTAGAAPVVQNGTLFVPIEMINAAESTK